MICLLGGLTIHVPLQESEGAEGTWLVITKQLGTKGEESRNLAEAALTAGMSKQPESGPFILLYCKIPRRPAKAAVN